jgi:hypothetical protein
MKLIKLFIILFLFTSCGYQGTNVSIEQETGWQKRYDTYYEVGSETPYSGIYISKSKNDNVTVQFKNGKMDGDFLRLNNNGDTTEYRLYKNGHKTIQIDFGYKNGQRQWRETNNEKKVTINDEQIFEKVKSLILLNDYDNLQSFLNSYNTYKTEFRILTSQFGRLNSIEIIEITNVFDSYNKREDLRAQMIFSYEDIKLRTSLLIIKDSTGNLRGQGFGIKPVSNELIPDNKITEVIDILKHKDVDRFLSIKHIDEKHRLEIKEYLNDFGTISSTYQFLNTDFLLGAEMIYLKNYLVDIDGKKQILTLRYTAITKNNLDLRLFYITPQRRPFEVMHF